MTVSELKSSENNRLKAELQMLQIDSKATSIRKDDEKMNLRQEIQDLKELH